MTKRNFQAKEYAAEQQASYVEDIESQLRDLQDDYIRVVKQSLRTERITLEVTHDCPTNLRDWHFWGRDD